MDDLKTPLFDVKKQLLLNELSPSCDGACEHCLMNLKTYEVLRTGV